MTNGEAVNWLINISADIGKAEHRDLWHYEQALSEIREMLETAQSEPSQAARDIATILENEKDMRVIKKNAESESCADTISRKVAIDAISSMFAPTPTQKDMVEDCLEIIENLPSVQPEPCEEKI